MALEECSKTGSRYMRSIGFLHFILISCYLVAAPSLVQQNARHLLSGENTDLCTEGNTRRDEGGDTLLQTREFSKLGQDGCWGSPRLILHLAPWTMAALSLASRQDTARIFQRESAHPNEKYLEIPTSTFGISSVVSDSEANLKWRTPKEIPPKALNFCSFLLAPTLTWADNQGPPDSSGTPPRWIPKDTNRRNLDSLGKRKFQKQYNYYP